MYLTHARKAFLSPKLHIRLHQNSGGNHIQSICRFLNTTVDQGGGPTVATEKKVAANKLKVTIPGQATREGTEKFIIDSGIQLFHKFHVSKLYINPIVHGPPRLPPLRLKQRINQRLADNQLLTAVHRNWSNMIYVYNHYSDSLKGGYWNATVLPHIMLRKTIKGAPNPHYRPRESLVTVAGLGLVTSSSDMLERLVHACETTGLEKIDFAIIEVSKCWDCNLCNEHDRQALFYILLTKPSEKDLSVSS